MKANEELPEWLAKQKQKNPFKQILDGEYEPVGNRPEEIYK